jgi:hypothetical protein
MLDTFPPEAKEEITALKDLVFHYKIKYLADEVELYNLRLRVKELEARDAARRTQDVIRSL